MNLSERNNNEKELKKILGLVAVSALALTGCSGNNAGESNNSDSTLVVGATPVPHGTNIGICLKRTSSESGLETGNKTVH